MSLQLNQYKSSLFWLGTVIASSTLIGGIAQADTPATTSRTNNSNNTSLIQAIANDPIVTPPIDKTSPTNSTSVESTFFQRMEQDKISGIDANETAQNVSSVSQLSDVRPTDWAFTALQSLVERYGCIAGYPDRTFRGKQATSRYEFAAGLNACLDKINEIISAGLADKVSKEDLATLKKLQEEFAAELATLRGRVDALDAKVT
ncbi:MAG: iron uptake porin, partial [Pseudanabaena sp.]